MSSGLGDIGFGGQGHVDRRAVDDADKREIIERLYALWTYKECRYMRLGQLIGNVFHSTDSGGMRLYHTEDYRMLDAMENLYHGLYENDPEPPEVRAE